MATYNKIAGAVEFMQEALNAGTDQWAIALTNTTPSGTTFTAGTSDLVTGGGYTQGGNNVATTSSAEATGTYKLVLVSPSVWTATTGFTFRYATLVNKTNNIQVAYWDYGSSQVVAASETVTVTLDGTNGVYQIV